MNLKELLKKKPLTSIEAYTLTKYGTPMNEEKLLLKYIEKIDDNMVNKANSGLFNLVLDVDPKFPNIINKLIETYTNRGFVSMIIDEKTDNRITNPKIFISWT